MMRITFFFLTSHSFTTMSQFQSHINKFHAMTDASSILHLNAQHSFHQATEQLKGLARSVPDNKDKLVEDQEIWMEAFGKAIAGLTHLACCTSCALVAY